MESVEFAKFLISRASADDRHDDQNVSWGATKLHKLLYICDGLLLAMGFDLIKERPKAWNYGPVYPEVYEWLKKNPDAFMCKQVCDLATSKKFEELNVKSLIDFVLKHYGTWTASALSMWSHQPDSPWESAIDRGGINTVITKSDMRTYFKRFLKHENDSK
ncbi:MAG: SocA family protein [Planctomycetaceae bacterium]|nr:SocA family protein [Planctomycetaceae bacterium]